MMYIKDVQFKCLKRNDISNKATDITFKSRFVIHRALTNSTSKQNFESHLKIIHNELLELL